MSIGAGNALAVPCGTDPTCKANSAACTDEGGTYNPDLGTCNTGTTNTTNTTNSTSSSGDGIVVEGSGDNIFSLLQTVINGLFAIIAFVVIGVIIIAGIQYSTSSGNPQAAGEAKKKINSAILALVVLALLYPFLQWLVPGGAFSN
jgi:uncharacterized membrane protein YraQ (UPF0718 family)